MTTAYWTNAGTRPPDHPRRSRSANSRLGTVPVGLGTKSAAAIGSVGLAKQQPYDALGSLGGTGVCNASTGAVEQVRQCVHSDQTGQHPDKDEVGGSSPPRPTELKRPKRDHLSTIRTVVCHFRVPIHVTLVAIGQAGDGLSGGDAGTSYFVLGGLLACSRWPGNTACDDPGLRAGRRMGSGA
jgi:hypothetical protein